MHRTYLILAVQFKIFFGFQSVRVDILWRRFDAVSDVRENLLGAEHAIGVESGVAGQGVNKIKHSSCRVTAYP